jgi:hypothetical protein
MMTSELNALRAGHIVRHHGTKKLYIVQYWREGEKHCELLVQPVELYNGVYIIKTKARGRMFKKVWVPTCNLGLIEGEAAL